MTYFEPTTCPGCRVRDDDIFHLRAQLAQVTQERDLYQAEVERLFRNEEQLDTLRAHLAQLRNVLRPIVERRLIRDTVAHNEVCQAFADLPDAPMDLLTEEERPWVEHARGIIRKAIETGHLAEYPPTYTKMLVILDRIAPKPKEIT